MYKSIDMGKYKHSAHVVQTTVHCSVQKSGCQVKRGGVTVVFCSVADKREMFRRSCQVKWGVVFLVLCLGGSKGELFDWQVKWLVAINN